MASSYMSVLVDSDGNPQDITVESEGSLVTNATMGSDSVSGSLTRDEISALFPLQLDNDAKSSITDSKSVSEAFSFGDWLEVKSNPSTLVRDSSSMFFHPEGSFLALLNDKSEEDLEALLKRTESDYDMLEPKSSLFSILPEIRELIWHKLPPSALTKIRLTCKKFKDEIDNEIGILLNLHDGKEESLRLALTAAVQKLIIIQMEMTSLGKLILPHPLKLRSLKIQGSVSCDTIHEILLRCPNIEVLEVFHKLENLVGRYARDSLIQEWIEGSLFKPIEDIMYVYGCFNKLRCLRFRTGENRSSSSLLLKNGLLPLLLSINSQKLSEIDIKLCVTPEESRLLTDALFEVFLKCRNLRMLRLQHYRSETYTFDPIPNVDQDKKTSNYALKFSEHRPFPQFRDLHLEMPEFFYGFFDWISLLKRQDQLRKLVWDVGGQYWLYPVQLIMKSARTLETLTLRMLRCYQTNVDGGDTDSSPEPLSLGHFHEFISLKSLHIIGMELATCEFSRMELIPKNIETLQIESFQVSAEQLKVIHNALPSLKFLSLNYWNYENRFNFLASLGVVCEMLLENNGKYKGLTFLEKSMYTEVEQLTEMNEMLDHIKVIARANQLHVDSISGDNGIGFILVINSLPTSSQ